MGLSGFGWIADVTWKATEVDADLTDAVGAIDFSRLGDDFWLNVQSDGGDVRMTKSDETSEVAIEIADGFNTTSKIGWGFFSIDGTLSSTVDTTFKLQWDNAGASLYAEDATFGREAIWDANHVLVWHLAEDPGGTAPQMLDSTSLDHDGTSVGTMTSADLFDSRVGKGMDLDATDDAITHADHADWTFTGDFTIEVSYEPDQGSVTQYILWNLNFGTNQGYSLYRFSDNKIYFDYRDGDAGTHSLGSTASHTTGDTYVSATRTGSTQAIRTNGAADGSAGGAGSSTINPDMTLYVGGRAGVSFMNGQISEVRLSKVARADAWLDWNHSVMYTNSTAAVLGTPVTQGAGPPAGGLALLGVGV